MKGHRQLLAVATAVLALPLFAFSQTSNNSNASAQMPMRGQHEATLMRPVRAVLVHSLDADKDHDGATVQARLEQKVKLSNGTELPKNTILEGKVAKDDMQQQGTSKLALRFTSARMKDGSTLPVRATIVGYYSPGTLMNNDLGGTDYGMQQVPNDWTARTLQLDQENVLRGVDLHSNIASKNSAVFVATKRDDVKLPAGSELQFAIAPGNAGMHEDNGSMAGGQ